MIVLRIRHLHLQTCALAIRIETYRAPEVEERPEHLYMNWTPIPTTPQYNQVFLQMFCINMQLSF